MASGIVINGQLVLTPGVYTKTVAAGLNGTNAAARGILAVLTTAKAGGEPNVPVLLSNGAALRSWLAGDPALASDLDKACFSPSKDARVPNGASGVLFVRVNDADRASLTVADAATPAVNSVKFNAKDWGALGNSVKVKQEAGTDTGVKVTVSDGTTTDVIDNIGPNPMLNITYDDEHEAYVNSVKGIILPYTDTTPDSLAAGVYVRWNASFESATSGTRVLAWSTVNLTVDGLISVTNLDSASPVDYVFTGIDKATGLAATKTVSFSAHDTSTKTTSPTEFSSLTSITLPDLDGADVTFEANAFALTAATYNTLGKVVDRINSVGGQKKFTASAVTGRTTFLVTAMDRNGGDPADEWTGAESLTGASGYDFAAELDNYVTKVNAGTTLVVAEKVALANTLPDPDGFSYTFLTGGADNESDPQWQDGLDAIRNLACSAVWCNTTDAAVHAKLNTHVFYANGRGRMERQGFVGIVGDSTIAELSASVSAINYCGISPWAQGIKNYDYTDTLTEYGPEWQALHAAAMEQGRTNDDSILFATMDIQGLVDGDGWDQYNYTEQLCAAGVGFAQQDPITGVYRVMNQPTAHKADDNPVLTSMFSTGSWLRSTQNVRRVLFDRIGRGNWTGGAASVKAIVARELDRQVGAHEIKAYDANSITVTDLGNAYSVAWRVAPAEEIKFIDGTAYVQRMPSNA